MGSKRRQKKRAKRERRRKTKKKEMRRQKSNSSTGGPPKRMIRRAGSFPVHECLIGDNWQEKMMANIVLSRRQPDGLIAFGVYLVDIGCLGLKSTFCNANFSTARYEQELKGRMEDGFELVDCPLALAHEIIYGGIDYAEQLGFRPDRDFRLSRHFLEPRERFEEEKIGVEFGENGQPYYCAGPNDDVRKVMQTLDRAVGEGNYKFIAPAGGFGEFTNEPF